MKAFMSDKNLNSHALTIIRPNKAFLSEVKI